MNKHTPDGSIEEKMDKIIEEIKANGEIIDEIANDVAKMEEEEKNKE